MKIITTMMMITIEKEKNVRLIKLIESFMFHELTIMEHCTIFN